jgi:hypothetical protein
MATKNTLWHTVLQGQKSGLADTGLEV